MGNINILWSKTPLLFPYLLLSGFPSSVRLNSPGPSIRHASNENDHEALDVQTDQPCPEDPHWLPSVALEGIERGYALHLLTVMRFCFLGARCKAFWRTQIRCSAV